MTSVNYLYSFASGKHSYNSLVIDAAGRVIGTSPESGTVFELVPGATNPTILFTFTYDTQGQYGTGPRGLFVDAGGNLIGTNSGSGYSGYGTVFEIAATAGGYQSSPTPLAYFDRTSTGGDPQTAVIADTNGNLFGVTTIGGTYGNGTVYEIPFSGGQYGSLMVLGSLSSAPFGSLTIDSQGNLFGTTYGVSSLSGAGTIFEVAYNSGSGGYGAPATLYTFDGVDLANPTTGLSMDASGNLYGTTRYGGLGYGAVFKLTQAGSGYGAPEILATFTSDADGNPNGTPLIDAAGNLFGTTSGGFGTSGGILYEIAAGSRGYTVLANFTGDSPSGLTADASGNLYGTTYSGGANGSGGVFELSGTGFVSTGHAIQGYLSGSDVFVDVNGNLVLDPGEASATTGANGAFALPSGLGQLVVTGGTDTSTNLAFTGRLTAPAGSSVVTPLTTLVNLLSTGPGALSVADAQQAVLTSLGLTLPGGADLDHFDAIAGLLGGSADAAAAYAADTEVYDTVRMAAAALGDGTNAQADIFQALANSIAASPSAPLDLTDSATLAGIVRDVLALGTSPTVPTDTQIDQIASVIAASNTLSLQGAYAGTPVEAYRQISAVAHVAQADATTALGDLASLDATVSNFTGPPLVAAVTAAEADVSVPCFCTGTMIRTPGGERPVETLRVGDKVLTASGAVRPITWIGTGRVLVTPARRTAATPVIIRKSALADNVPNRDLRVTKGHSLFLDGVLIPAEFLINHRSVLWDDHARVNEFFHIELDAHDLLLANGAPAESYRDDGNRWLFLNGNQRWATEAEPPCAPVLTGGPRVDAVWRRLLDRAGQRPDVPLTNDPDLHLLADGVPVASALGGSDRTLFRLARTPRSVRLVSRAASPAELGLARDPRVLGIALRAARVWQGASVRLLKAADERLTDGFHGYEPAEEIRWTDGDCALPDALFEKLRGGCEVEVIMGGRTHYPALTNWRATSAADRTQRLADDGLVAA